MLFQCFAVVTMMVVYIFYNDLIRRTAFDTSNRTVRFYFYIQMHLLSQKGKGRGFMYDYLVQIPHRRWQDIAKSRKQDYVCMAISSSDTSQPA